MGRYSDSEDEKRRRKKKKKKRSRSRSLSSDDSKLSSKAKKSKKSKHKRKSRSRSRDGYRRSRSRSRGRRSRSYDRKSRSRSRGRRSRSPIYRKSRSLSRERYSRRRSTSGSYDRRRRSRSYSRDRYSRSRSRDRYSRSRSRERRKGKSRRRSRSDDRSRGNSSKYDSRSPSRVKVKEEKPVDPCTNVPGFSEMTPSEKAQVRMQMALKAAAAADEKIKEQLNRGPVSGSFEDQMKFSSAVNDIESSTFVQTSFKSNRNDKPVEVKKEKDDFTFGTAAEFKPDMNPRKALNLDEFTDFAHPNLHVDPDVKMERWIQRLTSLRRRKLEGEVIT